MDAHPLKPLLAPRSLIVLTDPPGQRSSEAERLLETLKAQRFHGEFAVADVQRSGTLAELAATRADLAVLALAAPALREGVELAGRMGCRAVLALGSGVPASEVAVLRELAQRERLHLLGPNTLGLQNPALGLNASLLGPLAEPGPLALVSQSGALAAAMLDWGWATAWAFRSWWRSGRIRRSTWPSCCSIWRAAAAPRPSCCTSSTSPTRAAS
jgi:acetyltransferase